jgi:phenylalanyl-tRNA synthetase beta chain
MKLSYRWLNEFIKIDDIDPAEISLRLTMCTAEIESVEEIGGHLDRVVVGRILEVKPHPKSDHLFLTRVDVGTEVLNIVSGAPNTKQDTHVPVALVGARLQGGMKVKKAKLRGAESHGVVCSEMELGISDDHSGLWILDSEVVHSGKLEAGTPVEELFPTRDHIFEIDNKSITNRPDLWGHYGFVRELSAIFGREAAPLIEEKILESFMRGGAGPAIGVEILDEDLCPRYSAIALRGIRIEKSPYSIRRRLSSLGVRPISNIVDVTNYVMLLTGQPLHAFDAKQIAERKIIVRRARRGERVTTLDAVERICSPDTLLITDPEKAVAVAGVMGGLNSEIDGTTDEIIIEAANFNPVNIRRTAVRLGLRTEASNRFEKSLDPELTMMGLCGSADLVLRLVPDATLSSPLADAFPGKPEMRVIGLRCAWVSQILGMSIDRERIVGILRSLQFEVEDSDGDELTVGVPSFRATKDVTIPQDLVEEIGRIYGYDNLAPVLPRIESAPPDRVDSLTFSRELKSLLAGDLAFTELYTYSFIDDVLTDLFYGAGHDGFVQLRNPVSAEMSRMRKSLIPNLFGIIEKNSTYREEFSVFEIGSVYVPSPDRKKQGNSLPDERRYIAGMALRQVHGGSSRSAFFDVKGVLELLFHRLDVTDVFFRPLSESSGHTHTYDTAAAGTREVYHPGRSALLCAGETCFGVMAELNPRLLKRTGIDFHRCRVGFFELELELLLDLVRRFRTGKRYAPVPKFPEVVLALAVVVEEQVPVQEVNEFIESFESALIARVELFDVYRGAPLAQGQKSLAFNVFYRRDDRTLTEEEAKEVHEEIAESIRAHGWDLR